MPELPEVETTRRSVQRALKGKHIAAVIADREDRIVYDQASAQAVVAALDGARVTGTGRKGKYFWITLDRKPWPVFHLGMTGNVHIRRGVGQFAKAWDGLKLWSESSLQDQHPKVLPYCRIRILMEDGTEFALTDPRRFGRIRLAHDPEREAPISTLGWDPLLGFPSARELFDVVRKRKTPIKALLLDQSVFAGVGNWIADEVLFQARLSPLRSSAALTLTEVARLRTKLLAIIKLSVGERADYDRYPRSWLFHHRWGKAEDARTSARHPIRFDTVGGRTTAWVPALQK